MHWTFCILCPFACILKPAFVNSVTSLHSGQCRDIVFFILLRRPALASVFAVQPLLLPSVVRAFLCFFLGILRRYCILRPVPLLAFVVCGLLASIARGGVPSLSRVPFALAVAWSLLRLLLCIDQRSIFQFCSCCSSFINHSCLVEGRGDAHRVRSEMRTAFPRHRGATWLFSRPFSFPFLYVRFNFLNDLKVSFRSPSNSAAAIVSKVSLIHH